MTYEQKIAHMKDFVRRNSSIVAVMQECKRVGLTPEEMSRSITEMTGNHPALRTPEEVQKARLATEEFILALVHGNRGEAIALMTVVMAGLCARFGTKLERIGEDLVALGTRRMLEEGHEEVTAPTEEWPDVGE